MGLILDFGCRMSDFGGGEVVESLGRYFTQRRKGKAMKVIAP
jgi:hypothetical protein